MKHTEVNEISPWLVEVRVYEGGRLVEIRREVAPTKVSYHRGLMSIGTSAGVVRPKLTVSR